MARHRQPRKVVPPVIPTTLKRRFGGTLIRPGDAGYDEARALWNGLVDRRPALIARCRSVSDVVAAVDHARTRELPLAVRGGGHNVAGLAGVDDGVVIDLSEMNEVEVDAERKLVRVGGGATWGEVDRATQAFALATPGGVVSATGVAGLTLGGGMGWLRRRYGLACDNLEAAEVVTADGRVVRASATENPDLWWGLRGGGGNFGVVTRFEFRLHPLGPEVAFAFVLYPLERAREVLRRHEAFISREPGEVSTVAVLGRVPAAEPFPGELHGRPFVALLGMHAGAADEGERALQPLREFGEPLADLSAVMPYVDAQRLLDADYPDGGRYYWKSIRMAALPDEAIDLLAAQLERAPAAHSTIDVWYHGGAVARPAAGPGAFGRRDVPYLIAYEANWQRPDGDAANIAWVRESLRELQPHAAGGSYLNFGGFLEEGAAQVQAAVRDAYPRLVALKDRWDPDNLFRLNHNVAPSGGDSRRRS